MNRALIPGTYDPVTLGHIDIIERAARVFDKVFVAVAASPRKGAGPIFSEEERVAFIEDAVSGLSNVEVCLFDNLLVTFAEDMGVDSIVKGLRAVTDFEWEFQQASINYQLNRNLETMFIMANPRYMYLSSSMVKELASLGGDISRWVTPLVETKLLEYFSAQQED
ncbi:MAG: pantetheine-phosphate adenylyltransferase [Coriobacteriia bacterium]|nr:pantetheine-phosphate adenylyltransferase [Coriobacteriia bacterium]MCL2749405.1 pantetheine-phosphate adenylyltransferase [Coriobacteriia bacterium]